MFKWPLLVFLISLPAIFAANDKYIYVPYHERGHAINLQIDYDGGGVYDAILAVRLDDGFVFTRASTAYARDSPPSRPCFLFGTIGTSSNVCERIFAVSADNHNITRMPYMRAKSSGCQMLALEGNILMMEKSNMHDSKSVKYVGTYMPSKDATFTHATHSYEGITEHLDTTVFIDKDYVKHPDAFEVFCVSPYTN